jgi:hypothetical protein
VDPHHVDADPDSTYHPDADPDSDFYFLMQMRIRIRVRLFTLMRIQIQIQILASKRHKTFERKCSNRRVCHTFWLFICKLMPIRFRIQLITFDAGPDEDPELDFYLMRMRIQVNKMMRIWTRNPILVVAR